MNILNFLSNMYSASLLINTAVHLIIISIFGLLATRLFSGRSAPVRSLISMGSLIAVSMVFLLSIGFRSSGIAWYSSSLFDFISKYSVSKINTNITPSVTKESAKNNPSNRKLNIQPSVKLTSAKALSSSQFTNEFYSANSDIFSPTHPLSQQQTNSINLRILFISINILGLIWLSGFIIQLSRLGYGLFLVKKFRVGLSAIIDKRYNKMISDIAVSFAKSRITKLYSSHKIESPITLGLLHPVVIIPEKLLPAINGNELKSILIHELAHIYNNDQIIGIIKRIIMAITWWNPAIYAINTIHEQSREEVSDNYVLQELHPKLYTQCLTDLAEKVCLITNFPAAAGMAGKRSTLSTRVEKILSGKRSIVMRTNNYLKAGVILFIAVFTLGIAGINNRITAEEKSDSGSMIQEFSDNYLALLQESKSLTQEKVKELEAKAVKNPDDLQSQTLLLMYYSAKRTGNESKRDKTIIWLIKNHPDAEVLGQFEGDINRSLSLQEDDIAALWKAQLKKHPENLRVIYNAGTYFTAEYPDQAIECFNKGKELDTENTLWDRKLEQTLTRKKDNGIVNELSQEVRDLTEEDVAELESIVGKNPDDVRSYTLLIMYYSRKSAENFNKQILDESLIKKRDNLVLQLIKNHPDANVLGMMQYCGINAGTTELWKQQLKKYPNNLKVIYNAANSLAILDIDQAIECFKMGKKLDPENKEWGQRLEAIYIIKKEREKRGLNDNIFMLYQESQNFTTERVTELEALIEKDPDDIKSQTLLILYYTGKESNDENIRMKREKNILWLIRNHPDATIVGSYYGRLNDSKQRESEVSALWETQLKKHPNDIKVISNAGNYFMHINSTDQAIFCFKLVKSLDPENVQWDQTLGEAYSFKMKNSTGDEKKKWARESLHYYESAYKNSKPQSFSFQSPGQPSRTVEFPDIIKASLLIKMATYALAAEEFIKAADYANQMLSTDPGFMNKGDYTFSGNYILGMLAVKNSDTQKACKYLLAAGDTTGSARLKFFGPNMTLAKELLDKGEKDTVLEFLKKCQKFWTTTPNLCGQWITEIQEGKTPDFGRNLNL